METQTSLCSSIVWAVVWVRRWEKRSAKRTIGCGTESPKDVADEGQERLMATKLTPDTNELREIARLSTESALPRAARFLADLVRDAGFVEARILPLLAEAKHRRDWYVAREYGGGGGPHPLQGLLLPPGNRTPVPHPPPRG